MKSEAGLTVVELLVTLVASVLLLSIAGSAYVTSLQVAQRTLRETEGSQTASLAWSILAAEVRGHADAAGYAVGPGDSIRLRAFRGGGWLCPEDPPGLVRVAYRGDRSPNPQKDSVLALTDRGAWVALRLDRVGSAGPCARTGVLVRTWTLDPPPPPLLYVRLFESGTYSVEGAALRYRVGLGGRQPVTAARFDSTAALGPASSSSVLGAAVTLPLAWDPYMPARPAGRRVAWPRRRTP